MPCKTKILWKASILDLQTNKGWIHLTLCLPLNCCTTYLNFYFSSPSNTSPFKSQYRGNPKIHFLGKHLIAVGQGLHHAKFSSSLCCCVLPVVKWRKSWLQTKPFFWWTVVCIWSRRLKLDLSGPTERPAFAFNIVVIFANTKLKRQLLEQGVAINYHS